MEPLVAVSVAGNICQFLEFTAKIIAETREVYVSSTGLSQDATSLASITVSLRQLCENLGTREHGDRLGTLAENCRDDAVALLSLLDKAKAENPGKKWDSLKACLISVGKKGKIQGLERRLSRHREQLLLELDVMRG